jgi:hypothetical protein
MQLKFEGPIQMKTILRSWQPIRELEAWSVPGKLLAAEYAKEVFQCELWKVTALDNHIKTETQE